MNGPGSAIAHFITGHEQTQSNEFVIFISLIWSLFPRDITNQKYFIFSGPFGSVSSFLVK